MARNSREIVLEKRTKQYVKGRWQRGEFGLGIGCIDVYINILVCISYYPCIHSSIPECNYMPTNLYTCMHACIRAIEWKPFQSADPTASVTAVSVHEASLATNTQHVKNTRAESRNKQNDDEQHRLRTEGLTCITHMYGRYDPNKC